jgi:hypothetical protein
MHVRLVSKFMLRGSSMADMIMFTGIQGGWGWTDLRDVVHRAKGVCGHHHVKGLGLHIHILTLEPHNSCGKGEVMFELLRSHRPVEVGVGIDTHPLGDRRILPATEIRSRTKAKFKHFTADIFNYSASAIIIKMM